MRLSLSILLLLVTIGHIYAVGPIVSVQTQRTDDPYSPPIITLGNDGETILMKFDEIAPEHSYLRYQLVHCDPQWQPTGLTDAEYLDGFNEGIIDDYDYSRSTLTQYVHYRLQVPNPDLRPTLSGNYLIRVYSEDDPDTTLATGRFSITEATMGVAIEATSRTDIDSNLAHQQLNITVDRRGTPVVDRMNDLTVVVSQNGRQDADVTVRTPLRADADRMYFHHLRPLIFPAGNEYRRFETTSTTYPGMRIDSIEPNPRIYQAWVETDYPRTDQPYIYDQTQAGRYTVREYNSSQPDTEADYILTHFTLQMPRLQGYDIYLEGDLTSRRLDNSNRMRYNDTLGCYQLSLPLKQGSYNYQYLAVKEGTQKGNASVIEGNHYQSANEYTVRVFHRPHGSRYHRLTGASTIRIE